MARSNLSVDSDVFEDFSRQTRRQNKTLFAFANETLSTVCKICDEGGNVAELYPTWRTVSLLKQIDVMTLPADFLDTLIAKEYAGDKEGVLRMFWDLGANLVGVLKFVADDIQGLEDVAKDLSLLLPIKRMKITNLEDDAVEIGIAGAGKRIESSECSAEFIKAVLNGYGYSVASQEVGVGTIRMLARKKHSF
ncbi:MAG: hypothetical protein JRN08_07690 [Nitrososphaerota archaeon]|nr:hypothetical protein [Nitrososphaerota archaeon]